MALQQRAGKNRQPRGKYSSAFCAALPYTLPIFPAFWFLGMTYGIYMHTMGFAFWFPMIMSLTIFAGSSEFIVANLMLGAFDPLQTFLMIFMINARHLFYGISMLDKYKGTGIKKLYLIFGLCDENFSINYAATPPEGVDTGWFMFFVTLLNHFYWFTGSTLGGLFGPLITFNTQGVDFAMTALFVVIFMEQWYKDKSHVSALLGIGLSLICLIIFGADHFIIPSMLSILAVLTLLRRPISKGDPDQCL
jgi:4-azaleucine resistance transporter AzlC